MARDYIYIDGQITQNQGEWSDECFVYQRMRTFGEDLQHTSEHIGLLNEASQVLFGSQLSPTAKELQQAVAKLIRYSGRRPDMPHIVEIRLYDEGRFTCRTNETSLYKKFSLRAVHPNGVAYTSQNCFGTLPTSAFQSELNLMRSHLTYQASGSVVVACGSDNSILHIDGGTPIMMKGHDIIVATTPKSVTAKMVADAATNIDGYKTHFRNFTLSEALEAEELIYVDERGITSLARLDNQRFATIIAHTLAARITE